MRNGTVNPMQSCGGGGDSRGVKNVNKVWYFNKKYKVNIIKDKGFTLKIKLLEPYPLQTPSGIKTLPIGYIMNVGYWQVREKSGSWEEIECRKLKEAEKS